MKYFTKFSRGRWFLCVGVWVALMCLLLTYPLDRALPFYDWTFHTVYAEVLLWTALCWQRVARPLYPLALSWGSLVLGSGLLLVLLVHALAGVPLPTARLLLKWGIALLVVEGVYHWSRINLGEIILLRVSIALLIAVSGWTLLYAVLAEGNSERWMNGPFNNAGVLGNYLVGLWPYSLALCSCGLTKGIARFSSKWLMQFAIVALGAGAIALTLARAAWLGGGAALLVVLWLSQPLAWRIRYRWMLVSLLVFGISSGAILLATIMKSASAFGRLHIFLVGARMATQGFPLGLGIGQVYVQFNEFQANYFAASPHDWKQKLVAYDTYEVFNSALHTLIEAGLPGILFYSGSLVLLGWVAYRLYHTERPRISQIGALGALVALLISSGLSNPFHHWPVLLIACWSLALLPLPTVQLRASGFRIWGVAIMQVGILASIVLVGRYLYGAHLWQQAAEQALTEASFTVAAENYEAAYPFLAREGSFLYNYGSELSVAQQGNKAVSLLHQARHYYTSAELYSYLGQAYEQTAQQDAAAKAFRHAIDMIPAQMYPRYRLFLLYRRIGKNDAAWQVGQQLLAMPIKIPSAATQQMQVAVQQEVLRLARESLER